MKTKLLLGSAVLASAFAMTLPSAMAITPNSTTAEACLNKTCNTGTTGAGISGGGFSSKASVDGYTLHSYSEYRPTMVYPEFKAVSLVTDQEILPQKYFRTSGYANVYQNFSAIVGGSGSVNFAWDGELFSEGNGLTAGFSFSGAVFRNGGLVDSFFVEGENPGVGTDTVDKTKGINISFNQGDTISVRASLTTHVNKFNKIIICEVDRRCELPSVSRLLDENDIYQIGGPAAFANFSNTGSFNIVGRGLQAVPVPAAVWFLGSALLGLVGFSRKKAAA